MIKNILTGRDIMCHDVILDKEKFIEFIKDLSSLLEE